MNGLNSTYCQAILNATFSSTFVGSTFTGKEKDFESGYHYFGARYYDSELLTGWLSVDPMSDKYPHVSPYNYCDWNPVVIIDPNGKFGVSTHKEILKRAIKSYQGAELSAQQFKDLLSGVGKYADLTKENSKDRTVHFDNMMFSDILDNYKKVCGDLKNNWGQNNKAAGVALHSIMDLYAHSNYVELLVEYYSKNGLSLDDDIPTFDQVMNDSQHADLRDYVSNNLRTGTYDYDNPVSSSLSRDPKSHHKMNKDGGGLFSPKGRSLIEGTNITYFKLAKLLAEKDVANRLSKLEQQ